jgi:hypothetical protein
MENDKMINDKMIKDKGINGRGGESPLSFYHSATYALHGANRT